MEQIFYDMMETGVGPARFIGFIFLMIFAGIKLFFYDSSGTRL